MTAVFEPEIGVNQGGQNYTLLQHVFRGYQLYMRTEGHASSTITVTTCCISKLLRFLETFNHPTDVRNIGPNQIRSYILYLQERRAWANHPYIKCRERPLSPTTISDYLRPLSAFWSWLVSEEITTTNPFTRVRIPKPTRKVIPVFTAAQIEAMLDAAQHDMHTSYRNRAIILLLLDTGLRVSELCGLDLEDVNFESGIIKVLGKGARERHVPIGSGVQRCLWRYVTQYRQEPHPSAGKALFLTAMRFRMTKSAVEIFIRKCGCAAGITGVRCSPHTFRHTFALSYLRNGGDVFSLQRILGHSSLEMVRRYVNLAQSDVKEIHSRCSPVDHLKGNKNSVPYR